MARLLATGTWTHDHPLTAAELGLMGLTVNVGIPSEERKLMQLYPQPRGRTPAVEYAPWPREPAAGPEGAAARRPQLRRLRGRRARGARGAGGRGTVAVA